MRTFVPGDTNGVTLKLKLSKISAWAANEGVQREDRSRLSVSTSCGTIVSQYTEEDFGSQVHRPAMRQLLKVRMDLSAAWWWWRLGRYQLDIYT